MKVIAVIPVYGRLPLLKFTIQRLLVKNKAHEVICLGETQEEYDCCTKAGARFVWHKNKPIGRKLNVGFQIAKEYKPDAVTFNGSADWLCDSWFDICESYVGKFDLVGKTDFNMAHISADGIDMIHWTGYAAGSGREYEPIGIGRVLSSSALDKMDWMPFDDFLDRSLDYSMIFSLMKVKGTGYLYNSPEIQSLSVSCDLWDNMHKLENGIEFKLPTKWLWMWFPEIFEIEL